MFENVTVPEYVKQAEKSITDESAEPSMGVLSFNLNQQFIFGLDKVKLGPEVEIVILAVSPPKNFVNRRAYWIKDIKEDETASLPDCSSPDGVRPYPEIAKPQVDKCNKCPQSIKGTAKTGKGSACHQSKMILFVWPDRVQEGLNRFKAPASSLKSLNDYIYAVNSELGSPIAAVITGVRFNQDSEWTQPEFFFKKFLPEKVMSITCQMATSPTIAKLGRSEPRQIEDKTAIAEVGADVGPTASGADEPDDFIDNLFNAPPVVVEEVEQPGEFEIFIGQIAEVMSLDRLKAILKEENVSLMAELNEDQKQEVIKTVGIVKLRLTKESQTDEIIPDSPVSQSYDDDPWGMIKEKAHLPALLAALKKKGSEYAVLKLPDFIKKAGVLNDVEFDEAVHGVSVDGFPALCKDGSFKVKKSSKKKELPDPPDDIMSMLDNI